MGEGGGPGEDVAELEPALGGDHHGGKLLRQEVLVGGVVGQQHSGDVRHCDQLLDNLAAVGAGHEAVELAAQLAGGGDGVQGDAGQAGVVMLGQDEGGLEPGQGRGWEGLLEGPGEEEHFGGLERAWGPGCRGGKVLTWRREGVDCCFCSTKVDEIASDQIGSK